MFAVNLTYGIKEITNINYPCKTLIMKRILIAIFILLLLGTQLRFAQASDSGDEWFKKGGKYFDSENYREAINAFNNAIKLNPKDARIYHNRGAAYNNLGQYQQAIIDYNKAIELHPEIAKFYDNRGSAYSNLGNTQQAIIDYDKAISLYPEGGNFYYHKGIVYARIGNSEMAIANMKRAARLGNQQAMSYLRMRGIVLLQDEGKRSLGIHSFTRKK